MTTLCLCDWVETDLDRQRRLALTALAETAVADDAADSALVVPQRPVPTVAPSSHLEHSP